MGGWVGQLGWVGGWVGCLVLRQPQRDPPPPPPPLVSKGLARRHTWHRICKLQCLRVVGSRGSESDHGPSLDEQEAIFPGNMLYSELGCNIILVGS